MASAPYYDQKLTKSQLQALLARLGARHLPARSKPGILVYKLDGEGEAMVEAAAGLYRVRLFKGKCAC